MPLDYQTYPRVCWYHTWWGVTLMAILVLGLAGGAYVGFFAAKYWWQIRQGGGVDLMEEFAKKSGKNQPGRRLSEAEMNQLIGNAAHTLGNPNASTTIVEFLDFKCPNSKAASPIIEQLAQKYGRDIRVVIRHFPTESLHPGATQASELAHCAGEQGNFWGIHDLLFQEQDNLPKQLSQADIGNLAVELGLDGTRLQECLNSGRAKVAVNKDYTDGYKFGVIGTPTFFVEGEKISGVVPWENWDKFFMGK